MHYRFQHVMKFSKCFFKMFSTHFKHKNSPMVWTMLKTVLKTISNCFIVCWKPCWKFQGLGRTAEKGIDHLKTCFTELIQLKYKLILWIKTVGCCGLACVVWSKSCEKLRAFERNPSLWSSYLDALETTSLSLMTMPEISFRKFFQSKYGRKCNAMGTSNNDLMDFS